MIPIDDDLRNERIRQQQKTHHYQNTLNQHPDCRDPDHPGCKKCEPEAFPPAED